MTKLIDLRNVSVYRHGRLILDKVSLSVFQGELVGIFGQNGAGKTTLLRLINGLVSPLRGEICVFGRPLTNGNLSDARKKIAYVPQNINIDARMPICAFDVVLMGRYGKMGLLRRPAPEDMAAVNTGLELLEISHLALQPYGRLSGGEQQRVLIARAIAQEPMLLLLDEPTNSIDWEFRSRLVGIIKKAHNQLGLTTIVVSHEADFLASLCNRIAFMDAGKIQDVLDRQEFVQWYSGFRGA